MVYYYYYCCCWCCRSQWPCGLRRRSAAARLLRLWVRIPPRAWMSVLRVVCCQVEVSAMSWSLVQRSPTDCGSSLCVIVRLGQWGPLPLGAVAPKTILLLLLLLLLLLYCVDIVALKYRTFSDYHVVRFRVSFTSLTEEWQSPNWVDGEWSLCMHTCYCAMQRNERVPHPFAHYLVAQYVSENKNTCTDAASSYVVLGLGVSRLTQLWKRKKRKNLKL